MDSDDWIADTVIACAWTRGAQRRPGSKYFPTKLIYKLCHSSINMRRLLRTRIPLSVLCSCQLWLECRIHAPRTRQPEPIANHGNIYTNANMLFQQHSLLWNSLGMWDGDGKGDGGGKLIHLEKSSTSTDHIGNSVPRLFVSFNMRHMDTRARPSPLAAFVCTCI